MQRFHADYDADCLEALWRIARVRTVRPKRFFAGAVAVGIALLVLLTFAPPAQAMQAEPAVDIETLAALENADLPTGPTVLAGSSIQVTYVVTNIGTTSLTDVFVSSSYGSVDCGLGPGVAVPLMAVGEQVECVSNEVVFAGQQSLTGSVEANSGAVAVRDDDLTHWFGEEPPSGEVTVNLAKSTRDGVGDEVFDFVVDGVVVAQLGDGDNGSFTATTNRGALDIEETLPSGWILESIVCSSTGASYRSAGAIELINLPPGVTVDCEIVNRKVELIPLTITKEIVGADTTTDVFEVSVSSELGSSTLSFAPGRPAVTDVFLGDTVFIFELAPPPGWAFDSVECDGIEFLPFGDESFQAFNVPLDATQVDCTFVNRTQDPVTVNIIKETDVVNADNFTFRVGESFVQVRPGEPAQVSANVVNGEIRIEEWVGFAPWEFVDASCDVPFVLDGSAVDVLISDETEITCTFVNAYNPVTYNITKEVAAGSPDADFSFSVRSEAPVTVSSGSTVPIVNGVTNIVPIFETLPAGWVLDSVDCTGDRSYTVSEDLANGGVTLTGVEAGDIVDCTFVNRQETPLVTVTVTKVVEGDGAPFETFGIELATEPVAYIADGESIQGNFLPGDTVSVSELLNLLRAGWSFAGGECDGVPVTPEVDGFTFVVPEGSGPISCTMTNTWEPPGSLTYTKVVTGVDDGTDFLFFVHPDDTVTLRAGESVTFDALGTTTIAELDIPAGYEFVSATCQTSVGAVVFTNEVFTLEVGSGEDVSCAFVNNRSYSTVTSVGVSCGLTGCTGVDEVALAEIAAASDAEDSSQGLRLAALLGVLGAAAAGVFLFGRSRTRRS